MITIAHYISSSSRPVVVDANSVVTLPAFLADERERGTSTSASNSGTTTVSILSRQLSEAATRAETRAGGKSADLLDPITGDNYFASKSQHDIEIPTTQDPELLVRARQATGFVNGSDSNPFKNLSRDQLHLIAHDEGGSFTINERRAAWETMQPAELLDDSSPKPVSVNGRDIMISRLFGNSEPPGLNALPFLPKDWWYQMARARATLSPSMASRCWVRNWCVALLPSMRRV